MDILRKQAEFELALRVAGLKFSLFGVCAVYVSACLR